MRWSKFIVIVQAVLVIVFIIVFFLQAISGQEGGDLKLDEKGNFSFDFSGMERFFVGGGILLVILVIELILLAYFQ